MAHYEADAEMQALVDQIEAIKDQMSDLAVVRCKAALVELEELLDCRVEYWSGFYSAYIRLEKPLKVTIDHNSSVYDEYLKDIKSAEDFKVDWVRKDKNGKMLGKIHKILEPIFQLDMWLSDDQHAAELGHVTTDEE